jgi:glycosyltransferase involved in cell wall biosynthesis
MVLFLHNRYRATGGEERVVEDLMWLVREQLGEETQLLVRDSAVGSRARNEDRAQPGGHAWVGNRARAATGLLRGGLHPREVADAVRAGGARVVHAHNIHPTFGWRALAAARSAGARVVVHLHQYRLVCAVGVCFTQGEECVRCHGRNTLPGVLRNCRGSRAEALAYGAGLALWQRRVVEQADAVIVPSVFARERLRELGAPLPWERLHVLAPPVRALAEAGDAVAAKRAPTGYALVVARLAPEKGIDVAIEACSRVGIPLVVAGEGLGGAVGDDRQIGERTRDGDGGAVRFVGRVEGAHLAQLRAEAEIVLVPSRSAETFGLAAAEAMAAGVPVAGSRVGALPELIDAEGLAPPGDAVALAAAIERVRGDPGAGERARERVREMCAPESVARKLAQVYDGVSGLDSRRS